MKTYLVIIDPQNDFCDPEGALYVPGAEKDMDRLANMIQKHREQISNIQITLDSHHWVHIAHPIFWEGQNGEMPDIFTQIALKDVEGTHPKWKARNPAFQKNATHYVKSLANNGRYALTIWPPHCLIGTWGHNVYPTLTESLKYYQEQFTSIRYTTKGSNPFTEHYSAIKADVIDPQDPATNINLDFIHSLETADWVLFGGEASTHCVANTVNDVIKHMGEAYAKKFVILEDAMSPIKGFEPLLDQFKSETTAKGIHWETTENCFDFINNNH